MRLPLILASLLLYESTISIESEWFQDCREFFYQYEPPRLRYEITNRHHCLCERYNNMYYFATFYDTLNKIPVYSAYKVELFLKPDREEVTRKWRKGEGLQNNDQPFFTDYRGVSYLNLTRGHLATRFYFHTVDGRKATDVLTNIAPQYAKFNKIVWYSLEKSIYEATKKYCKPFGGVSYFLTGVLPSPNFTYNFLKQKINIPTDFWTAVCCDTSRASNANKFKGWSFAYLGTNHDFQMINVINIYTVEKFLKERKIMFGYTKLFRDIVVDNIQYRENVNNCLFDKNKTDEIIHHIVNENRNINVLVHRR